jgi:hypothetical protein
MYLVGSPCPQVRLQRPSVKLHSFLPALVVASVLTATTAAYHLVPHTAPLAPPQPDADRGPDDRAFEALFARSVARDLVAREVIAGRTTVPEAAALFAWLDARPPRTKAAWPGQLTEQAGLPDPGGYTGAEMYGVRVVSEVGVSARSDATLPPGCVDRARREFLATRARGAFDPLPVLPEDQCVQLLERARAEARRMTAARASTRPVQVAE